jgi:hypothetical protein
MGFVATSSPHPTTQQSLFRSRALLQVYSVEVGLQLQRTGLTTIYYSAVAAPALIGHGRLYVGVIEMVGNVTRIAWKKHSLLRVCFIPLARFVSSHLVDKCSICRDRIYTII